MASMVDSLEWGESPHRQTGSRVDGLLGDVLHAGVIEAFLREDLLSCPHDLAFAFFAYVGFRDMGSLPNK